MSEMTFHKYVKNMLQVAVVALVGFFSFHVSADTSNANFIKAKELYQAGKYEEALELGADLLKTKPNNVDYLILMGESYGKAAGEASMLTAMDYAKKSKQSFVKAVEIEPNNPNAIYPLIVFLVDAPSFVGGDVDAAEELVTRLQVIDKESGDKAQAYLDENG